MFVLPLGNGEVLNLGPGGRGEEAGSQMTVFNLYRRGIDFPAKLEDERAARIESTTGGDIARIGGLAMEDDLWPTPGGIRDGDY